MATRNIQSLLAKLNPVGINAVGGGTSTGTGGYSQIYGGVPQLPTSGGLQSNVSNILNQAIPGFGGLTNSATSHINNLMSGRLSPGAQNSIQDAGAAWGAQNGMPGFTPGSIGFNRSLRDIGTTSEAQQQRGFQDILALLSGYSGTAALTPGQVGDQENSRAVYASSPNPTAAGQHAESLFRNALAQNSTPSRAGGGGGSGTDSSLPWWARGKSQPNVTTTYRRPDGTIMANWNS